jgi:hypothetical protein
MSKCHLATLIIPAVFTLGGVVACGTAAAETTPLSEMRTHQALRVLADPARGRRWELGLGEVFVYDTASGALIRRIRLPGASFTGARGACLPGMVLARDGALIVSSNANPALWRISPARFELERFELTLDSDQDKDFGFSTLAWGDDETLQGTSAIMGSSWRIDLESATATKIAASPSLRGACR